MANPFKELKRQAKANEIIEAGWEEVDGPMQCQKVGCLFVASTGLYSAEAKILTWKCPDGHLSKLVNFEA